MAPSLTWVAYIAQKKRGRQKSGKSHTQNAEFIFGFTFMENEKLNLPYKIFHDQLKGKKLKCYALKEVGKNIIQLLAIVARP